MVLQIYFPRKQKVMTTKQVDKPRDNLSSPRDVRHMLKKISESNPSGAIILESKSAIFLRDGNCSSCPRKIRTNYYYTKVKNNVVNITFLFLFRTKNFQVLKTESKQKFAYMIYYKCFW